MLSPTFFIEDYKREEKSQKKSWQRQKLELSHMRMEEDVRLNLLDAAERGDLDSLIAFLDEGANIEVTDQNGQTPLILAAEKGHLNIVAELLNRNADANARDEDGWTALIAASKEGYADVVSLMLENGAKVNIPDMGGWTPLVWSSYKGHGEVVKELLQCGANPNERGQHNMTALIWAAGRGHAAVVWELLKAGAKAEVSDKYGTSALTWAARKGHFEVAKILLQDGANPNTSGTHGWTPLIMAAKGGYENVVSLLLEDFPNVNAVDQDGRSALAWAAKEGHELIVGKLLQKGAFLNMPDRHGETPLMLAAKEGHIRVVRPLVTAYADVEMMDMDNKTALYVAVEHGHLEVVNELLNAGANTEVANKEGETALLRGARKKLLHCVNLLIEKGANVSSADKRGDTILHIAVRNHCPEMCEMILNNPKHARLLYRPNKVGETPHNLDLQNKTPALRSVFHEKKVGLDLEKQELPDQQDQFMTTVADFLIEPSLTIPMTAGLYSRWGSGKSVHVQRLLELIEDYQSQEPLQPFGITLAVVWFALFIGVTCGLLVWVVMNWHQAVITAICIFMGILALFLSARVSLVSMNRGVHQYGIYVTNLLTRISWFLKLVYCIPPSIEEIRPMLPVHVISVDLTQTVLVGDNPMTSLVNLTREMNDAIESDLGMLIPRLYRIFRAGPYRIRMPTSLNLKTRWKMSCCCIPSILITALVILSLWVGLILFGIYDIQGTSVVIAIQIAVCCIIGGAALANTLRLFVMIYCLVLSMKKRVTIVSTQPGIREETFLHVLKQEIDLCVDMLECLDGFLRRQTRMIITLDLLDSLEQQKILHLMNSIKLLLSEPGHPFILVFAVDPRLLIKAVDQSLSAVQGPPVGPSDYLKNLVDLPIYISEPSNACNYEGILPVTIRNQVIDVESSEHYPDDEMEWDANGDLFSSQVGDGADEDNNNMSPVHNESLGLASKADQRSVRFPSADSVLYRQVAHDSESIVISTDYPHRLESRLSEDLSHLLRNNESGTLCDIKRIMNIVSLTGKVLRNYNTSFQWSRLAAWISLSDGWPYKSSWITLLCLDTSLPLAQNMSIKKLYNLVGYTMPLVGDPDLGTDGDLSYFEAFLSSIKPVLTIKDVRVFSRCMFYVDPTIKKLMVDYVTAVKSGSVSKTQSFTQSVASKSGPYPVSPNSSKFMWRSTTIQDYQLLTHMTTEEVGQQIQDIDGIDSLMIQAYQSRICDNNISGKVLAACDLNELRDVMKMTFGDWQLFKSWIVALRLKDNTNGRNEYASYHSSSHADSFVEDSPSESAPDSPKHNVATQKVLCLPALNETLPPTSTRASADSIPYTSHSPRNSPHPRNLSPMPPLSVKDDGNIKKKAHTLNNHINPVFPKVSNVHQRSADSGFMSVEVDSTHRPTHRPSRVSKQQNVDTWEGPNEDYKLQLNGAAVTGNLVTTMKSPADGNVLKSHGNNGAFYESKDTAVTVKGQSLKYLQSKSPEFDFAEESRALNFQNLYKADTFLSRASSTSCEESEHFDNDDLIHQKSWTFATLPSDDEVMRKNENHTMNLSDSFVRLHKLQENESQPSQNDQHANFHNKTTKRPLSLSDIPLPPASLLEDEIAAEWPLSGPNDESLALVNAQSDCDTFPSPPLEVKKKFALRASKLRGMSNYASSSEGDMGHYGSENENGRLIWEHHENRSVFRKVNPEKKNLIIKSNTISTSPRPGMNMNSKKEEETQL